MFISVMNLQKKKCIATLINPLFYFTDMEFVTVIEHNAKCVNLPENVYQVIGPTLPHDCYFFLDVGPIIIGIINRRIDNIHTYTQAICRAYGGVDSVEVSITYTVDRRFNVVRIMPEEDDVGSDSTDSDYGTFLDDYDGSDVGDEPTVSVVTNL